MAPPPPRRSAPMFSGLAGALDKSKGRLRETVEAVTVQDEGALKGVGALHLAAGNERLEICSYLVEGLRVNVDAVDCGDKTPLLHAMYGESVVTFKYLLDHGANQDKVNIDGFAPLHSAAGLGYCEMVELLLAKGAYSDPINSCGTPLHIAATEGQDRTMKILLDHNADEEPVDQKRIAELKAQGSKAVARKDFLSAAEFYSMAMELDPDDATLFSNRSLCWLHIGEGGKPLLSLLDAYECKRKRPDWTKACYRQSKALMLLKEYKGACDALMDGLKLDPWNAEIEDELRKAIQSLKLSATTKVM
ncbi:unnamed protein product [Urochloa decumbens]|uniref:Uncharacterized protein n=1 Tax=Urochloa decumbens TaxID=240449 RepID=A0ABC8ZWW9_9POAL